MMPIKMYTMARPNDGIQIGFGIPMSNRFQCMAQYNFSNKEEAEVEINATYMGSGS